jgi:hypothetical protein
MAVRCAKCGEELLGAVNRCWKCGTMFAARPEIDGRPPVRVEMPPAEAMLNAAPLDAVLLDEPPQAALTPGAAAAPPPADAPATFVAPQPYLPTPPTATVAPIPRPARPVARTTPADRVEGLRKSNMAMGGTVGALVLGVFALVLSLFRFEAALIALLGLIMGIWGLNSPRRNWALVAMLLCCLAIGLGSYTGAMQLYVYLQKNRPVQMQDDSLDLAQ